MRKLGVLIAFIAALAFAQTANAEITSVFDGELLCTTKPSGVRECSGPGGADSNAPANTVPSWDGTPIDINVAFPDETEFGPGPYPMAMYFHGFGGGKESFNGDLKRFTDAGFAAFSMTERGFKKSCGKEDAIDALNLATPGACDNGFIHLMDTRYEVRDAQYFAGLLADEDLVLPKKIGTVGASYGGGKSMALASLKNRIMLPDGTLTPWLSQDGKEMEIAVAAPIVPWTDFAYSLLPNGTTLDYITESPYGDKFGVMKAGIINMLFGSGDNFSGDFGPVVDNWDIRGWKDTMADGEPYNTPTSDLIKEEMTKHHSSFYIDDEGVAPAPMIIAEGLTDDLFPVDEAVRFYNRAKTNHPDSTVGLLFADIGHPRAPLGGPYAKGRPEDQEMGYQIVDDWFSYYLRDEGNKPVANMMLKTQVCPYSEPSGGPFEAESWAALAPGELRLSDPTARTIKANGGDSEIATGFSTLNDGCTTQLETREPGVVEYTFPTTPAGGFTLAGSPTVIADMNVANGAESQVAARLLEVQGGLERIIARGVYRPDSSGRQVFQLHGNGYTLKPGSKVRLQLLPRDGDTGPVGMALSYIRPSNDQKDVRIGNVEVRVPVMEQPGSLGGLVKKPAPKVVPHGSRLMADFAATGAVRPVGAPVSIKRARVRGKVMQIRLFCVNANLCRNATVKVGGVSRRGPVRRGLVAGRTGVRVTAGSSAVVALRLTARARKLFKNRRKRVRRRGKVRVRTFPGRKRLAAKIVVRNADQITRGPLMIKRVGPVR